jgi:AAA family ATP:ADP antiporter
LFLPTSSEVKYKAKATIDAFFYRFGDMLQAGLVAVGSWFSFTSTDYARLNVVAALLWFGIAMAAAREYRKRTQLAPTPITSRQSVATMRAAA